MRPLTLDQIEEMRQGVRPGLSLQQASDNVGLSFKTCQECSGRGWTKATLLASMASMRILAAQNPNEPPSIQYDRCCLCRGAGGWLT
jgi:hypothetical protein